MTNIIDPVLQWTAAPGLPASLIALSIKGAIILAAALVAAVLLRRAQASLRHLCLAAAVAAVVALPLASVALPEWRSAILPPEGETTDVMSEQDLATPEKNLAASKGRHVDAAEKAREPLVQRRTDASVAAVASAESRYSAAIFSMIWLVGMLLVLLYMIIASLRAWLVVSRARPVTDPRWLDALDEIQDRLAIERPVQLLASSSVDVPMVWGLLRPVVLLPASADEWDDERRRCVLAHELAHVRRLDCMTQTVAGLACAMHWFNPLVWQAARRMRLERELACDDHVLRSARTRPSGYAAHLIDIARQAPRTVTAPVGAIAMARRTQLEGRVLSILEHRKTRIPGPGAAAAVVLTALVLMVPVAAFKPVPQIVPPAVVAAPTPSIAYVPAAAGAPEALAAVAIAGTVARAAAADVLEQVFSVSPDGVLSIDTDNGSIEIHTDDGNQVRMKVHRTSRGGADVDEFVVSAEQEGNHVEITGESPGRGGWRNAIDVRFVVTVPRRFNVELETSGGNISVEDLEGQIQAETSGGNLSFGRVSGTIRAETSGGNINLEETDGDVEVETSGGEIRIGRVGGRVDAETSGGNIIVDGVTGDLRVATSGGNVRLGRIGGTVEAETSGGNITVDEVGGNINAETSGGSISARITKQPAGDSRLETSGGTVEVSLADDIRLDVEARTSGGSISIDLPVTIQRKVENELLIGTINGGGPLLELDGSSVRIKRL